MAKAKSNQDLQDSIMVEGEKKFTEPLTDKSNRDVLANP